MRHDANWNGEIENTNKFTFCKIRRSVPLNAFDCNLKLLQSIKPWAFHIVCTPCPIVVVSGVSCALSSSCLIFVTSFTANLTSRLLSTFWPILIATPSLEWLKAHRLLIAWECENRIYPNSGVHPFFGKSFRTVLHSRPAFAVLSSAFARSRHIHL